MFRNFRPLVLAAAALALAALPASAGPPWIGIEIPANPLHAGSRDALLLVRAYHHGTVMQFPVTGTAEGIVNGQRRSQALAFTETAWTGVYALRYEVPREGAWILVISVRQSAEESDAATALVRVHNGEVVGVRVPTRGRGPRTVSPRDVDEALRAHAAALATTPARPGATLALAGVGLAAVLVVGLVRR